MDVQSVEDPGAVAARDASRRLERSRRAALEQALAARRRCYAARAAMSLADVLSDVADGSSGTGRWA